MEEHRLALAQRERGSAAAARLRRHVRGVSRHRRKDSGEEEEFEWLSHLFS